MAILAECPVCHKKQSRKNKKCKCGEDLDKAKRSTRVRYWIFYRLPGDKQKSEAVGYSLEEAKDAEGKRRSQKRENRIFDIVPEAKMTFVELTNWYLHLESVKNIGSYDRIKGALGQFNAVLGDRIINSITKEDLKTYQIKRKKNGKALATIDMEISIARTMLYAAFDDKKIGGHVLETFRQVKKLLKPSANARDRILNPDEYQKLMAFLPVHMKPVLAIAFYTGMRKGEILLLTWDKVDLKKRLIILEADDTKDKEPRKIPILSELYKMLNEIPKAIHDKHVILYNGKPIKRDFRASLTRACELAGIPYGRFIKGGFIFHDIRHTYNTNMRKAGADQSVIMAITGHSTYEMFERYNTVDEDDILNAADKMERFLKNVYQNVYQEPQKTASEKKED